MRSSKLNRRVEIWQTTSTRHGFGGFTTTDEIIAKSWAAISTFDTTSKYAKQVLESGISSTGQAIKITMRKRRDLTYNSKNQFIVYRGYKYIIHTDPTNDDFNDSFIKFIGVRQGLYEVSEIEPINNPIPSPTEYFRLSTEGVDFVILDNSDLSEEDRHPQADTKPYFFGNYIVFRGILNPFGDGNDKNNTYLVNSLRDQDGNEFEDLDALKAFLSENTDYSPSDELGEEANITSPDHITQSPSTEITYTATADRKGDWFVINDNGTGIEIDRISGEIVGTTPTNNTTIEIAFRGYDLSRATKVLQINIV